MKASWTDRLRLAALRRLSPYVPTRPCRYPRAVTVPVWEEFEVCPVSPGPRPEVHCDVITACHPPHLPFVAESIRSILNQANAVCWVHLVFDGNFDGQDELVTAFRDCPTVRFYRTPSSVGPYRIANEMVPHLRSDFLAIQDSDDIALPNRIWRSVTVLQSLGADAFAAAMEQFVDHRHPSPTALAKLEADPFHQSGVRWAMTPTGNLINGTLVLRRSTFEKLNGYGDFFSNADVDLNYRMLTSGIRVHLSNQIVALRRLHDASMTSTDYRIDSQSSRSIQSEIAERQARLKRGEVTAASLGSLDEHLRHPVVSPITEW